MRSYKLIFFSIQLIILIIPFYAFSEYGLDNSLYTNLKYLLRIVLLGLILFNVKYFKIKLIKKSSSYKFYLFYIICAIISVLFSGNKIYSIIKLLEIIILLLTAIIIVNKYTNSIYDIPKVTFILLGVYILGFLVIANTFYPSLYRYMGNEGQPRLGGSLVNPNLLGYCLLIFIISLEFLKNKKYSLFLVVISCYLIYLTYSRSVLIFLLGYLFFRYVYKNKFLLIVGFISCLLSINLVYNKLLEFFERGEGLERVFSFSGRLPIWQELISIYELNIYSFFGFGFQMLSESGLGVKISSFGDHHSTELTMAHNNFIQVLYGMGFVGLFFSIMVLVKFYSEIFKLNSARLNKFFTNSFWAILFFSIVEFGIFGSPNILVLIFSIFIFSIFKYDRFKID